MAYTIQSRQIMEDNEYTGLWRCLAAYALDLSTRYGPPPIPIARVCYDIGLDIVRDPELGHFGAEIRLGGLSYRRPKIALPANSPGRHSTVRGDAFERFCIAHELGHYLIFKDFGIIPTPGKEYWKHEDLCERFARAILMPKDYLIGLLQALATTSDDLLLLAAGVAQSAKVSPWIQAATAISELEPSYVFICLRGTQQPASLKIASTSLPNRQGMGTRRGMGTQIKASDPAFNLIIGFVRESPWNL